MIRAVIFDLGHTLWDIGPHRESLEAAYAEARQILVRRLGPNDLPDAEALQRAVRDALRDAAESYFNNGTQVEQPPSWTWVDRGCRALGLDMPRDLLLEITPPLFATELDALICHDGTLEAVHELADAGLALGCVTNTLADGATIRRMLEIHGIDGLMGSVVVSSEEGWRKPHVSLFQKAMRELGVSAPEAIFVGDSPWHDVAGAHDAGMRAVLTRQYVARPFTEEDPQPDAVIDHLHELPAVIAAWDRETKGG
jgi:FMN phosphatase YigB (HAD superfamily)